MNGIHDLGGMTCFGPIDRHEGPVFPTHWERRTFALNIATLAFFGPIDRARHAVERMDPIEYLATSYYEHWFSGIETLGQELGYLTRQEIESGTALTATQTPEPAPNAEMITGLANQGVPASRESGPAPKFEVGATVRARNMEIPGHTRLPRYVRGRTGVITRLHGNHVFPDTAAHDEGENPQPLYNVRFAATELWGDNVQRKDCVYIDLWQDYLQSANGA